MLHSLAGIPASSLLTLLTPYPAHSSPSSPFTLLTLLTLHPPNPPLKEGSLPPHSSPSSLLSFILSNPPHFYPIVSNPPHSKPPLEGGIPISSLLTLIPPNPPLKENSLSPHS